MKLREAMVRAEAQRLAMGSGDRECVAELVKVELPPGARGYVLRETRNFYSDLASVGSSDMA